MRRDYAPARFRRSFSVRAAIAATAAVVLGAVAVPRAVDLPPAAAAFYGFGDDQNGQLAIDPTADPPGPSINITPRLETIAGSGGPLVGAVGFQFSVVATTTGELYSFGGNTFGQLGRPTPPSGYDFVPTLVTLPGATGGVIQVAAGHAHTVVLTSAGEIFTFGLNDHGQLGTATNSGTLNRNETPILVTMPPTMTGTVVRIAAGSGQTFAATSTGELYAWGRNYEGQLGYNNFSTIDQDNPVPTLIALPGLNGTIEEIAPGFGHTLVLSSTGQLFGFGDNSVGQLAGAPLAAGLTMVLPTLIPDVGTVAHIGAGVEHSLIVDPSDHVYAFGWNRYGELGNATNLGTINGNATPALVALSGKTGNVVQVTGGYEDSLVVTSTGQLFTFGFNQNGELGTAQIVTGGYLATPTPTLVPFPDGVAIGSVLWGVEADHTLAIASSTASAPGAPTGVSAVAGNASATVSWTPPASNGGSAITGFTATSSPGGLTAVAAANATSVIVSGLTNGTSYTFSVTASNSSGPGPASSPSNAVTPATVPGTPTGVSAVGGNASATVSWTPPASNGGSAITGYTATSSPGGLTGTAAANATSALVSGLTNGTTYTFTVTAANAMGPGPASSPSNGVTPSGVVATGAFPISATVTTGSLLSGTVANLAADDGSLFTVNSTTKGTRATSWYGTFTNVPASLSSLQVTYSGLNSTGCTQTIAIYKASTKKWITLDSRSVGSTKVVIANLVPSGTLGNYVSRNGQVLVQVGCAAGKSSFTASGDLMEIVYIPGNPI